MLDKTLADKLAGIAVKQIRLGLSDPKRKARLENNKKNTEAYENVVPPAMRGEFSFAVPVYSGYIDTLVSKLNDPIRINFDKQEEADLKKAKKVTAKWEYDSAPARGGYRRIDIDGKREVANNAVAVFEKHAEIRNVDGKDHFVDVFRSVKGEDFYCEPKKGWNLEWHNFLGEINIVRTSWELDKGVESKIYDEEQVKALKAAHSDGDFKMNDPIFVGSAAGKIEGSSETNYTGEDAYNLTGHYMMYEGTRYYLLMDYPTGKWIRAEKMIDMFEKPYGAANPLWNYQSWSAHPSTRTFWVKAPGDDVRPVHETTRVMLNLAMLNLKQRTKKKRAVDPNFFPDSREITDAITEVVEANSIPGRAMSEGVYEFQTEDNTRIVVNLTSFINNLLGEKTGITPGAQGNSKEDTATVYVGNIEQVANRMNLYSEFYHFFWAQIGLLYFLGLRQHFVEGEFVKTLGLVGYEWHELLEDDVHPIRDFDINITGGAEQAALSSARKKEKREALRDALTYFKGNVNPQKAVEELLRTGDWEDEDIREFLDLDSYGGREILAEAAQAIQDICAGSDPKVNRRANSAFILKVIDYADDFEGENTDNYERLYAYALLHVDIVAKNAARRASVIAAQMMVPPEGAALPPPAPTTTTVGAPPAPTPVPVA